jgi:predicted transcriptional regulator
MDNRELLLSIGMAQVSVTISDETEKLLEEMAQATGLTKSSLASEILRQGLYREAQNMTVVANFRAKNKATDDLPSSSEEKPNKKPPAPDGSGGRKKRS